MDRRALFGCELTGIGMGKADTFALVRPWHLFTDFSSAPKKATGVP